ncbi:MAG: type II secretion system protein [Ilumatobacter sp.]|nr:type II secretion system protein [Ilumatobacter sp.]
MTLIEMIVTIALLGLVVVGILGAVRASINASSVAYSTAELETVLVNAADRVDRATQRCEYEAYVDAAALASGWPLDAITADVELLVANSGNPSTDWAPQACPADVRPFDVQRVTITASTPEGNATRTMIVVKSDVE